MRIDAHGAIKAEAVEDEKFNWAWVRMTLLSPNTISCSLAWFFLLILPYVSNTAFIGSYAGVPDTSRAFHFFCLLLSKLLDTLLPLPNYLQFHQTSMQFALC